MKGKEDKAEDVRGEGVAEKADEKEGREEEMGKGEE